MLLLAPSSITAILYATISAASLLQCAVATSSSHHHQARSRDHARHQQLAKRDSTSHALTKRGEHYGKATFYDAETGNQGACGGFIKNSDWVVAIKGTMYGDYGRKSWWCEQLITITANGKTARNVRIGDACPGCPEGESLDMTPGLFAYFDNPDKGVIPITWHLTSEDGQGQQEQEEQKKKEEEERKKKEEWKPLAPVSSIWKAPIQSWSPPSSPSKKEEEKWTPPSSSSSPAQEQWTPSASAQRQGSSSSMRNNTSSPSATSSSFNATRTLASNSTLAANVTLSNSTDLGGRLRGNNTVVLPSAMGGLPPARGAGSNGSFKNKKSGGNLHRNAQVVLDLAGLAYAASRLQ